MGYSYDHEIRKAGNYVLDLLTKNDFVDYNYFYDGSDETADRIRREMGLDEEHRHWEIPEPLIDLAVDQLESQGIVSTRELDDLLADEQNDYRIEVTQKGKTLIND